MLIIGLYSCYNFCNSYQESYQNCPVITRTNLEQAPVSHGRKPETIQELLVQAEQLGVPGSIDTLLFAPDDADIIKAMLLDLIEHETQAIHAALFRLTD